ncbi:MAG: hypothetical protein M1839_009515 [Geoglossum umbratile]|nr:MAG: hypothetical protein M1839_009515 [Geoglossum umbratile]
MAAGLAAVPKGWIIGEEKYNNRYPHQDSIKALWETKWKFPCTRGLYPFHDGAYEDFERIFDELIKKNINDGYSDEFTRAFFPVCESVVRQAEAAEANKDTPKAIELYLRAACLYRISRFPHQISTIPGVKTDAWETQKRVYLRGASLFVPPVREELIPHTHASGDDSLTIPVYVRLPTNASRDNPVPSILLITGLDGYRPDNTQRSQEFINRGWGCVIAEIPGTADCPADPKDPKSPDRLWSSVLDWMDGQGCFDTKKIMVWGLSCGGYYATRVAHTHRERLRGAVGQGAGTHHFFGKEWLKCVDNHEYPFAATPALALKHGYDSVEEYREGAQKKFSLVETGIVDMPATRLLLVNGMSDGLMPIEDSLLLFQYGTPKEGR